MFIDYPQKGCCCLCVNPECLFKNELQGFLSRGGRWAAAMVWGSRDRWTLTVAFKQTIDALMESTWPTVFLTLVLLTFGQPASGD